MKKKSPYQLWKESKEKGLSSQEFKDSLIKEGIIRNCGCGNCNTHNHECNEEASIYILSSGERIPATDENREKYQAQITSNSVACSICGRAAIDSAMWLSLDEE